MSNDFNKGNFMSETQTPQVNLNISDISDAVKVIDHAADQGAFRGWSNIRQVIGLRDRLEAFITAAGAHVQPPEAQPTTGEEPSGDTATAVTGE
jgi:hypothetical protein